MVEKGPAAIADAAGERLSDRDIHMTIRASR
jgi:hypothetical protein